MPLTWIAAKSDLPACDEVKEIFANGKILCVANVNGEICAMDNICPHWGGPLGKGRIENGKLVCPWHGWSFDPKTGLAPRKKGMFTRFTRSELKEKMYLWTLKKPAARQRVSST